MHEYLLPHVTRCFENALAYHCAFWDYTPSERITVTLFDIGDYGNAGATAIPKNRVAVMMAPTGFAYETSPANERINTIMNHELVHVMALDKAAGSDRFFRSLFGGKVEETADNPLTIMYGYLTTPRMAAPRWFHEGIAVFMETWMAGGLGRAQGAFDEMVFRTMILDSARFYDPVGLESEAMKTDFQVGVLAYLYGTRFFDYLAYHYGPESLVDWVSRSSGSSAYFSSQFKKTYNMPLSQSWQDWIHWEREFQEANIDTLRQYPITRYRSIVEKPLGSLSRAYYHGDERCLYLAINYPGQVAHLARINIESGEIDKLCDIKGAALYYVTSLAYDSLSQSLFYTTDNGEWRDLHIVDIESGKSRMLQEDARIGDLIFNYADSSLWGIRHFNGISTIVQMPHPYEKWRQVYSWPYGQAMYDIDISPDGTKLTGALAFINGHQNFIMMDISRLLAGDTTYTALFDFGTGNPANFVFSADGRYLYGSSYYTGVSNIFRYDLANDSLEGVTNCETGMFHPLPISDDSLIVYRFSGDGFQPVIVGDSIIEDINPIKLLGTEMVGFYPQTKDWMIASPGEIDIDSLIIDTGSYSPLGNFDLVAAYPIVEGFKDYAAFGMRFNLAEPIGMHSSDITVSYTPNKNLPADQRFHLGFNYSYLNWDLNFRYNGADFYDLFGPTKTSRKGYSLGLGYTRYLVYDGPRQFKYNLHIAGYGDLERMPDYQNVATTVNRFATVSLLFDYSNRTASLGAVDYEKGYMWQLAASGSYVNRQFHPLMHATTDLGMSLPLNHSSLWLRLAGGWSPGDHFDPFDNFFFGGFGNNWVDYRSVKRYRQYYAFPGTELDEIAGTNFGKAILEWSLPPLRFRHLGSTSFYLTWAHLTFFGTGLITNMDDEPMRRETTDAGAQLDFRLTLLSHLRMTLSVGYARAFEEGRRWSDEFMVSLKVL